MRDDLEDPERDVASRLEEMKSRELIQLLLNNYMFTLICYVCKSDVTPQSFQRILNFKCRIFKICSRKAKKKYCMKRKMNKMEVKA